MDLASSTSTFSRDSTHEMRLFHDPFSDAETETGAIIDSRVPAHGPGDVFVVKALLPATGAAGAGAGTSGGTVKYRVHCDPDATLAVLRDTLQNDEDKMMSADDRFHQGDFLVGKSSERHIKWRDILQDDVISIRPNLDPLGPSAMTRTIKKFIGGRTLSPSSSSPFSLPLPLPRATVPLHLLTKVGVGVRRYGNFAKEKGGYNHSSPWLYGGLVCHIWEKQELGMVPFRRVRVPKSEKSPEKTFLTASDECYEGWAENEKATIEYIVGYVYRSDNPCPEGAVPLFSLFDSKIGQVYTVSEREKDLCIRLGVQNLGVECYVAPP